MLLSVAAPRKNFPIVLECLYRRVNYQMSDIEIDTEAYFEDRAEKVFFRILVYT